MVWTLISTDRMVTLVNRAPAAYLLSGLSKPVALSNLRRLSGMTDSSYVVQLGITFLFFLLLPAQRHMCLPDLARERPTGGVVPRAEVDRRTAWK